jgi:apolipoprotein N-acyltransferase
MRRTLLLALLAVSAGVLWGLCFGREPLLVASWLALAPLPLLFSARRAGLLGFLHGLAAWWVGLYWIVPTLETYGGMPLPMGIASTSILIAYLALYHAAFAWLGAKIWRRGGVALTLVALPALWVALEWLRTYLGGGFPWNLAAYAWVDVPGALPLSAWIGPYGISFLILLSSTAVALSIQRRRWEPAVVGLTVPLLLLPMAARWSVRQGDEDLRAAGGTKAVRLLQPNIPNLVQYEAAAALRNYYKVIALSAESCQPGSLVVWPESAAWPFSYGRDPLLEADLRSMLDRGCSVLFNSSHPVGESFYNSAFLLSEGKAPIARYDKRHLVPFGEYVPFQGVFTWIDKLARNAGNFRRADELTLLPWKDEKIGMAICYEVVFPDEVVELARAGSTLFVTITNDAWYGDTSAPWQHFRAARFRAAENRRTLLRAAITGVSALVAPDGSVRSQIGVFEEGVIRTRVAGRTGLTPYARAPWLVPLLSTAVAAFAVYSVRRRRSTTS